MLRKSPGFTITAVLMLALGIGVNVALFSFLNLMFLRPLPVRDPATILQFDRTSAKGDGADSFSYPEAAFYRQHAKTLSAVWAVNMENLTLSGAAKPLDANFITANFFRELGALAVAGRLLDPQIDEASNAEPAAVLSYRFWQQQYNADPSVVGKVMRLNNKSVTIAGVASPRFSGLGLNAPDVWLPFSQAPYVLNTPHLLEDLSESGMNMRLWGRLQPGFTPRAAESELKSLAAELHRQHPKDTWANESLPSRPGGFANRVRGEMYPLLALIAALGLLILTAACITLGSLFLAKGSTRHREISIRSAIGASRSRILLQLFTESLALAALGSLAGLFLAYATQKALVAWAGLPSWIDAAPDWRVIFFATSIGLLATLLFGLTPAWQLARQTQSRMSMRQFLLGSQIAASCVLLIVASLLVRALQHAVSASPGFAYAKVISFEPNFHGYQPPQAREYFDQMQSRLQSVPGVVSTTLVSNPPLGHRFYVVPTAINGGHLNVHFNNITAHFFQTMQIPLLTGRDLHAGDGRQIVISESLARLAWPGENPLGKKLKMADDQTVVGVCGNAHLVSPEDSDAAEIYRWAPADLMPSMVLLVSTSSKPETVAPVLTSLARSIDEHSFPVVELLNSSYRDAIQTAGFGALSVGFLGVLALLLACTGMFGLTLNVVSQRTKEIGIRMALGASPRQVLSVILRQFAAPVLIGLFAGLAGAAALSQIVRQQLYGVSSFDPAAYLGSLTMFAIAVFLAALLPAKRALRVDPLNALRYD
jgi:predicted permease